MSAEKIIIEINPDQVSTQIQKGYNLTLAKKVNSEFTTIWQSRFAYPGAHPTYGPQQKFDITINFNGAGYTINDVSRGPVDFTSSAEPDFDKVRLEDPDR